NLIEQSLANPETRQIGMTLATATHDHRYQKNLKSLAENSMLPVEIRVAAIEGFSSFPETPVESLERFIESVRGKLSSNPLADAALRTISRIQNDTKRSVNVLTTLNHPIGLRREALRTLTRQQGGTEQILSLARSAKLPADLTNGATTLVHSDSGRRIRDE